MSPRINVIRVLAGGVLAGVVIIALNVAAPFVPGARMQLELNSWIPGSIAPAGDATIEG